MTNLSRRTFLQQSTVTTLGSFILPPFLTEAFTKHRLKEIGLIVNVLQEELKKDWEGTLREVAAIGYDYLEFGNYYGNSKESFKKFLKAIKLKPLSGGTSIAQLKKDDVFNKMVEETLFFEKKFLTCYWPWMDSGNHKKLDDFKKAADDLNTLGEKCNKAGVQFAFHNHDKEFVPVQGYQWGYDVLLQNTDYKNVAMLLDLYWITKGGGDPIQMLRKYPKRFIQFHVKDMDKTSEKLYTCPGYGVIDFPQIFAEAEKSGVKYYVVEIDKAPNPIQCIKDSYTYLKNLRF